MRNIATELFAGTIENVFHCDVGVCDPKVIDYIIGVVNDFVHVDRIYPFHNRVGKHLVLLQEIIDEAQLDVRSPSERTKKIYRYFGDFSLFWSGLYPEGVRRMNFGIAKSVDGYILQGKKFYSIAAELGLDDVEPPSYILKDISEHFEECVYGLNICRKEWK